MQISSQIRNRFRRTSHPEDTIETVENSFKQIGLKTFFVESHPHEYLWSVRLQVEDLRIAVNGKGPTRMEAIASAYCELVERISIGMLCGVQLAPYRALYGPAHEHITNVELFKYMKGYHWGHQDSFSNPVRAEDLLAEYKFTKGQYEHLKANSEFLRHWVPGYSLRYDKEVQVPVLFTKWISATNGVATGNTMEEAIIHACCEIFERDALIKYMRHMLPGEAKEVRKETIDDKRLQDIISYFRKNNVDVHIKDIGCDVYPAHAVLTFNKNMDDKRLGYNMIKAASSFDEADSILRCFTERMQGSTFETEVNTDPATLAVSDDRYMSVMFTGICTFGLTPYKYTKEQTEFTGYTMNDTKMEVHECIKIAESLDTDLIVINHTHPVLGLPTVRVVMPRVSDFMKWWDPQRLTLDFIGNLQPDEDIYERKLIRLLETFDTDSSHASDAENRSRRDV